MQFRFCFRPILASLTITAILSPSLTRRTLAQSPDVSGSGKLESVTVTGSVKFRSEQIAPATGLSPGAAVSKDDLQQGADRLVRLGLFAKVQYRYESADTGVRAEYQVTDGPTVRARFDNFPWFTDDELVAALKHDVPLFDGTVPENGSILDDVSQALVKLLATRGVHANISHTFTTAPMSGEQVQEFTVDNPGLKIAAVQFSDPLAQSDRGIQQRLSDLVGKPYSRSLIDLFEFEQVRPVYISHGFLNVKFTAPSAKIADDPGSAKITVVAPIDPGPTFAWNEVAWHGDWAVSPADLDKFVALKSGDPADGMKIESIWQSVRDEYARRGYLDTGLAISPQFDVGAKRVTYDVLITEGPRYRMGSLVLTGLSIEGERRVRAAWKIPDGAIFDKTIYEDFLSTGIAQAFTGLPFHYEKIGRFLQEDPQNATVDVLLDFQ